MIVGLIGAFMTAAVHDACIYLTFFGEYRGGHHGEHARHDVGDEPPSTTSPTAAAPTTTRTTAARTRATG